MENLLQRSRYELKYIIQETAAREIRAFARNHLMPDPFADPAAGYAYHIYSVYLDSPGKSLMNQTLEGLKNRFKLRVRFYDAQPDHPVFFEVKRRVNDVIVKVRAKVRREAADRLMYAHRAWPDRSDLANPDDDRGFTALAKFCQLRDKIGGVPSVLVGYTREAWCAPEDDSIRVTFDRGLEAASYDAERTFRLDRDESWVKPTLRSPGVVLELKFTDRFPNWMRQMVQTYNLSRTSMPKYVTCALAMAPTGSAMVRELDAARALVAARRWELEGRLARERNLADGNGHEAGTPAPAPDVAGGEAPAQAAWAPAAPVRPVNAQALMGAPGGIIL